MHFQCGRVADQSVIKLFDLILERKFRDMPGYQKVKAKSYLLQDSLTCEEIKHGKSFRACFRPGRRILMSMIFRHLQHEESSCPCCHAVNQDSGDPHVIWSVSQVERYRDDDTAPNISTAGYAKPNIEESRRLPTRGRMNRLFLVRRIHLAQAQRQRIREIMCLLQIRSKMKSVILKEFRL